MRCENFFSGRLRAELATTLISTFVNLQMHVLRRPLEGILRLSDAEVIVGEKKFSSVLGQNGPTPCF